MRPTAPLSIGPTYSMIYHRWPSKVRVADEEAPRCLNRSQETDSRSLTVPQLCIQLLWQVIAPYTICAPCPSPDDSGVYQGGAEFGNEMYLQQ